MTNDNFSIDGKLRIPTKWIVSVIAAISTALSGSGAAMYKIGKLEAQVDLLTQLCGKQLTQTAENLKSSAPKSTDSLSR